jgi:predicted permease
MFGRLLPDVSPADVSGELQTIWSTLAERFPATNTNLRLVVHPINDHYVGSRTHPAWIAFNTVGLLVLLVACANVANLLIMRGVSRGREMAVRASLGATRARIVRQLLAENVVLALVGGAVGLILSIAGARLLWVATPEGMLPHWMDFRMDPVLLGILVVVCLGSSLVFGLVPAFQLSRSNLDPVLKSGVRGTTRGVPSRRLTSTLLVAQFAVALGGLVSISSTVRALGGESPDAHIKADGLITMSVALPQGSYGTREQRGEFFDRLTRRLAEIDQIAAVAFTSHVPLGGAPDRVLMSDGQPAAASGPRPTLRVVNVSPGYFDTLGVSLLQGRAFEEQDGTAAEAPAIVNRRFVELHFPGASPIGRTIAIGSDPGAPAERFTIVGVSPNIRQRPQLEPDPIVYMVHRRSVPAQTSILVRGSGDQTAIAATLRQAMHSVDPEIALYRVMSLERSMSDASWNGRFSNAIASATAALTVLLSAIGIFALTAHAVSCMTPEIGMRAALGASRHHLLWRVIRRAVLQVVLGILGGFAFTFGWNRLLGGQSSPTGVGPMDFVTAATMLALVSAVACLVPAMRALRVSPVAALRYE